MNPSSPGRPGVLAGAARNLLDILAPGEPAQAYARVLAWLLDPRGDHRLGDDVLNSLADCLERSGLRWPEGALGDDVSFGVSERQHGERWVLTLFAGGQRLILVQELLGTADLVSLAPFRTGGARVVGLGLTEASFSRAVRAVVPVWTYEELLSVLESADGSDAHTHLVVEFREHLRGLLEAAAAEADAVDDTAGAGGTISAEATAAAVASATQAAKSVASESAAATLKSATEAAKAAANEATAAAVESATQVAKAAATEAAEAAVESAKAAATEAAETAALAAVSSAAEEARAAATAAAKSATAAAEAASAAAAESSKAAAGVAAAEAARIAAEAAAAESAKAGSGRSPKAKPRTAPTRAKALEKADAKARAQTLARAKARAAAAAEAHAEALAQAQAAAEAEAQRKKAETARAKRRAEEERKVEAEAAKKAEAEKKAKARKRSETGRLRVASGQRILKKQMDRLVEESKAEEAPAAIGNETTSLMAEMILSDDGRRAYMMGEVLGVGGQGRVFEAAISGDQDFEGFARPVERAVLKMAHADSQQALDRERKIYAKPDRGIIKLLDAGATKRRSYLILERLHQHPFERFAVRYGRVDVATAIDTFVNLLDILKDIHSPKGRDMVLCDIKPDNIMLRLSSSEDAIEEPDYLRRLATGSYEPVFIDVGCALDVSELRQSQGRLAELTGTPLYLPPEAIPGLVDDEFVPGHYSPKTDVYGLTLSFYEHLTGERPYAHRGLFQLRGEDYLREVFAFKRDKVAPFNTQKLTKMFGPADAEDFLKVLNAGLHPDPAKRATVLRQMQICKETFHVVERGKTKRGGTYFYDVCRGLRFWQQRFPRIKPEKNVYTGA